MQGLSIGLLGALLRVDACPRRSMKIASPGATSRVERVAGAFERDRFAGDHHSVPSASASPMHSGRMPYGSRNASSPWPAISATTAYEPLHAPVHARAPR